MSEAKCRLLFANMKPHLWESQNLVNACFRARTDCGKTWLLLLLLGMSQVSVQ
jgi:hypothetical protein